jgi:single-strand DNA-binding protein
MAAMSINRVVLTGNLTRDPEIRVLPSGKHVCHLRLACNRVRRDEAGAWQERPGFFDVSVFGAQAESVRRFCRKGRAIGVDGRLEWREWETPEKQRRQAVSVVAHSIEFLGRPEAPASGAPAGETDVAEPTEAVAPAEESGETVEETDAAPAGDALVF